MINIITEICYTCKSCRIMKQICGLRNKPIKNIYKDKCENYTARKMYKCELCECYVVTLPQHVTNYHNKTFSEYKIIIKTDTKHLTLRGKNVWDKK